MIIHNYWPEDDLINKLRNISMLQNSSILPYKNVSISLEYLDIHELTPSQDYILLKDLRNVEKLKFELQRLQDIDIFQLSGYLTIMDNNFSELYIDLLPIIVEECIMQNGKIYHIIADGMHRAYMAYLQHINPKVIFIRGIPKEYIYYAYPIRKKWNQISRFESKLPSTGSHI